MFKIISKPVSYFFEPSLLCQNSVSPLQSVVCAVSDLLSDQCEGSVIAAGEQSHVSLFNKFTEKFLRWEGVSQRNYEVKR